MKFNKATLKAMIFGRKTFRRYLNLYLKLNWPDLKGIFFKVRD